MTTAENVTDYHSREVEARKVATITGLGPVFAAYDAANPTQRTARLVIRIDRGSVAGEAYGWASWDGGMPTLLCEITRAWHQRGGEGWATIHPITQFCSEKNRYDAARACFRKLYREWKRSQS